MTSVFDIIGPRMVGPSSSHTAGALRLGLLARGLLGQTPERARVGLHGSFATTYQGHGTDRAVAAGLLTSVTYIAGSVEAELSWEGELVVGVVLLAGLVGGGLALAGVTFQAVLRNPLAEPYILGISGGASVAAVIVLSLGWAAAGSWLTWLVGRPLIRLNAEKCAREADLRFSLVRAHESAEVIALQKGERVTIPPPPTVADGIRLVLTSAPLRTVLLVWNVVLLGSGDRSQAGQRFRLRRHPTTFVHGRCDVGLGQHHQMRLVPPASDGARITRANQIDLVPARRIGQRDEQPFGTLWRAW